MPTARLIPSTYYRSNNSYVTVTNPDHMYTNVDSTTYASIQNTRNSTSNTYYCYLRGFDFDTVPSGAIVSDFSVKIRAYESYMSTSSSYRMSLYHGTTAISSTTVTSSLSTVATTFTFPNGSLTWEMLKGYGDDFGIRIPLRRSSTSNSSYIYVYGAEIEVTYTVPTPATVTSTLSGNGTISPNGATSTYEGAEYELTITPANVADTVTVTKNGVDVTSQLVAHGAESTTTVTPNDVTTSSIQSGSSYAEYAVGHSAESPYSSTSNMYASSGTTGYAAYSFDFSGIPSNATIEEIEVRCHGHRESNTISSTYVSQCALYVDSTAVSEEVDFPSTTASIITLTPSRSITRSELSDMTVRHFVGYYGGLVTGISFEVTYSTGSGLDHYTYTYTVDGDATIAVTIGGGSSTPPTITVGTPGRNIISDETGYNQCTCTFRSDMALQQWEARATKAGITPARGVGLLVESGTTLAANTDETVIVDFDELTDGDGEYTITVYGQSTGGAWSG